MGYYKADLGVTSKSEADEPTPIVWQESLVKNLRLADFCPVKIEFFHAFSKEMVVLSKCYDLRYPSYYLMSLFHI